MDFETPLPGVLQDLGDVGEDHREGQGEPNGLYEDRREGDRDTIERWARAEGADLDNEAERAKAKLRNVDRARE